MIRVHAKNTVFDTIFNGRVVSKTEAVRNVKLALKATHIAHKAEIANAKAVKAHRVAK